MFEVLFTTPGGVKYTLWQTESGGLRVAAESSAYGRHNSFVTLDSDGANPTVTVQHGPGSHVIVAPAGAGELLYNSEA